ncbi:hypothetical protein IW261DRAFT_1443751 [Armillaria novae-zelandiae]|uniref:Secreted protein n=1 Tax=Armillaria novae-zelandiae TaxID=153914 RepID=A0AA39PRK2_9AGAR|nr:hypothetical protein IW261DRAFT_1443751 [Armillaria novae-zelandiae]
MPWFGFLLISLLSSCLLSETSLLLFRFLLEDQPPSETVCFTRRHDFPKANILPPHLYFIVLCRHTSRWGEFTRLIDTRQGFEFVSAFK